MPVVVHRGVAQDGQEHCVASGRAIAKTPGAGLPAFGPVQWAVKVQACRRAVAGEECIIRDKPVLIML